MKINLKTNQQERNLEWQKLSNAARNVLENCWISVHYDTPTSGTFTIGKEVYNIENDLLTEEVIKEIFEHQKGNLDFNISVYDGKLTVSGAFRDGEWNKFEYVLTENGSKKLEVGDYLYKTTSKHVAAYQKVYVKKENKTFYLMDDGTKIPKKVIDENQNVTVEKNEYLNYHFQRETEEIKKRYERQQLEYEFENWFHLESIDEEKLKRIIDILKEDEEEILV